MKLKVSTAQKLIYMLECQIHPYDEETEQAAKWLINQDKSNEKVIIKRRFPAIITLLSLYYHFYYHHRFFHNQAVKFSK